MARIAARQPVALWWIDLDASASCDACLSADERARAARFVSPEVRRRFVAGRVAMRTILGRISDCAPAAVPIIFGPYGKPALAGADLAFNLSHTGGIAVLAVGGTRPLGVDCEAPIGERAAMLRTLDRFLSSDERRALGAGGAGDDGGDVGALYRIWTRKEALAKATGLGFRFPFRDATLFPERDDAAVAVPGQGMFRMLSLSLSLSPPFAVVATLCGVGPAPLTIGTNHMYDG